MTIAFGTSAYIRKVLYNYSKSTDKAKLPVLPFLKFFCKDFGAKLMRN